MPATLTISGLDVVFDAATAALAHADGDGMPPSGDRYAAALERWLALGAADLDERLPDAAVTAYSGTLLAVSHDERVLRGIRLTHRWLVIDGSVAVVAL